MIAVLLGNLGATARAGMNEKDVRDGAVYKREMSHAIESLIGYGLIERADEGRLCLTTLPQIKKGVGFNGEIDALENAWFKMARANDLCFMADEAAGLLRSMSNELFHLYQTIPGYDFETRRGIALETKTEKLAHDLSYAAHCKVSDALSDLIDLGVNSPPPTPGT